MGADLNGAGLDGVARDVAAIARIDVVPTILDVVCRTTGMGFAAIARVTEDRWVACGVRDEIAFGLQPGEELKVESTICHEIRMTGEPVVIDHVAEHPTYCSHATPAMYGFQSYISMPIRRPGGEFFGTLCALDPRPAPRLNTPETIGMFKLFADLVGFHLDAQERLATSEAALLGEREAADLREQFIAVLGHDLRNPLASIQAGVNLLRQTPLDEQAKSILTLMQSTVRRMSGLIDNVLDLARGRLGGGIVLDRRADERLRPALEQVVAEMQTAWPERAIDAEITLDGPVRCDRSRVAQLLSNLLSNALTHGAADQPILVRARIRDARFELTVANAGDPIDPDTLDRLFQPFFRASGRPDHQGLGLGLYIASEIARAHGGTLNVTSTPEATRFTFEMAA